ncbi:MAG: CAP domain-containing protein [Deltaproteobacteria bacterium]|nr:CAP domain-containing protein [Deltaproteobacteria bacterium]
MKTRCLSALCSFALASLALQGCGAVGMLDDGGDVLATRSDAVIDAVASDDAELEQDVAPVPMTTCERACRHVYGDCGQTLRDRSGAMLSEFECVDTCITGEFADARMCLETVMCSPSAIAACFGPVAEDAGEDSAQEDSATSPDVIRMDASVTQPDVIRRDSATSPDVVRMDAATSPDVVRMDSAADVRADVATVMDARTDARTDARADTSTGTDARVDAAAADAGGSAATRALEDEILRLVNQRRAMGATCGGVRYPAVGAVVANEALRLSSRRHSEDMARRNYFDHITPEGLTPFNRMDAVGYTFNPRGENLAAGSSTAAATMTQWMNSPGHCRNIMTAGYRALGVGYAYSASSTYRHYWTQNFGGR